MSEYGFQERHPVSDINGVEQASNAVQNMAADVESMVEKLDTAFSTFSETFTRMADALEGIERRGARLEEAINGVEHALRRLGDVVQDAANGQ